METLFKRAVTSIYEVKRTGRNSYALAGRDGERREVSWRKRMCSCGRVRLGWCMHLVYVALFHRRREHWSLETLVEARKEEEEVKRAKRGRRAEKTTAGRSSAPSPTACSICQTPVERATGGGTSTDCKHVFHTECIDRWVSQKLSEGRDACCPNCRTVMVVSDEGGAREIPSLFVHRRRFRSRRRLFIFSR